MTTALTKSIDSPVLLLNQNYQPLNVCSARRAIVLMSKGKAEVIVAGVGEITGATSVFEIPSVVRLFYMVKKPLVRRRLSRRALFYRDNFTCQYCGTPTRKLTIDHIVPRCRGGSHQWDNVVSACVPCNHKKAENLLSETSMALLSIPSSPKPNPYYMFYHRNIEHDWKPFIPWEN